jgi:hypothetical protein
MQNQDNQPRFSIVHSGKSLVNFTEAELLAVNGVDQVIIDNLKAAAALEIVNKKANKHIVAAYPEWKQLNLMRVGTVDEKNQMDSFIGAVQVWANSIEPVDADLLIITP